MKASSEDISHNCRVLFLCIYSFAIYIDHIYCEHRQLLRGRDCGFYTHALAALFLSSSATRRRFRRHTDAGDCMYECIHQITHSNSVSSAVKGEK